MNKTVRVLASLILIVVMIGLTSAVAGIATTANEVVEVNASYALSQPTLPEAEVLPEPKVVSPNYKIDLPVDLQEYIYNKSQEYGFDYELILAVFWQESKFDFEAYNVNSNGTVDRGLGQINSSYQYWYAELAGFSKEEFNPYDPYHSVAACLAGFNYFRDKWEGVGQEQLMHLVLNSYNAGETVVMRDYQNYGVVSRGYSRNVMDYREQLVTEGELK